MRASLLLLVILSCSVFGPPACAQYTADQGSRERLEKVSKDRSIGDAEAISLLAKEAAAVSTRDVTESVTVSKEAGGHLVRVVLRGQARHDRSNLIGWATAVLPESAHFAWVVHHYGRGRNLARIVIVRRFLMTALAYDTVAPRSPPIFTFEWLRPRTAGAPLTRVSPFAYFHGRTRPGIIDAQGPRFTQEQTAGFIELGRHEAAMRIVENNSQLLGLSGSRNLLPPRATLPDYRKRRGRAADEYQ